MRFLYVLINYYDISHFPLVLFNHTKVIKKGDRSASSASSGEIWHIKGCQEITSTGWYH
jgi:hypothetical protein